MALDLSTLSVDELQTLLGQIRGKTKEPDSSSLGTTTIFHTPEGDVDNPDYVLKSTGKKASSYPSEELGGSKSGGGESTRSSLSDIRVQFRKELEANPNLQHKLLSSVMAEVGNQGEEAQTAYLESVMNRAKARGQTLDETISDSGYYPAVTMARLNDRISPELGAKLSPIVNRVLAGSNVAKFATGNESGKVTSAGAPITFMAGGERFVVENPDAGWHKNISAGSGDDGSGVTSNVIELPSDLATWKMPSGVLSSEDVAKAAKYRSLQLAQGMEQAGTPLTVSEYKKLVLSQYAAIEKENVPAEPEKPKEIPGQQLEGLSVYANNFDILDNLQKLHANAVDKGAPGFGSWVEAGIPGLSGTAQKSTQEGVAFNTALEASVSQIARGLGGQTGVLTDKDLDVTRKYLPQPGDSKETAANKVAVMKAQARDMLGRKIQFYAASGYNTAGLAEIYKNMMTQTATEDQKSAGAPGDDQKQKQNTKDNVSKTLEDLTRQKRQSTNPAIQDWTKGFFGQ
ncbi:MAG TPA: hypothetical protein VFO40_01520 [Chthoniobacterales bacterium]|nr:hypothetical protein [Chthoniobacterales bacterium]